MRVINVAAMMIVLAGGAVAGPALAQDQGSAEDIALWCEAITRALVDSDQLPSIDALTIRAGAPAISAKADDAVGRLGLDAEAASELRLSYADEAEMQVADYFASGRDVAAFRLDYGQCS